MEKKRIAIDIDEVLADFVSSLWEFHNLKYGTSLKKENTSFYALEKLLFCSREEMKKRIDEFYNTPHFENIKPITGAVEAIEKLSKENELFAITSRPEHTAEKTKQWLEKHFPGKFKDIHFTAKGKKKKVEVCIENGIKIMIEDNLDYARECGSKGIKAFLINQPWNQSNEVHENVIRVNNWSEILRLIN